MDDVPSRSPEVSRPETDAGARGIYDVATDFAPMYREIMRGVQDFMGKRCTQDDYCELLQIVSANAWNRARDFPGCFARGELRGWAWSEARFRYKGLLKKRRRHALAELALQREYEAGNFDTPLAADEEILAQQERPRAVANALRLLDTVSQWVVIEVFFHNLTRREAARELGIAKGTVQRSIEKAKPVLASSLSDWDPRAPRVPSATQSTIRERGDR